MGAETKMSDKPNMRQIAELAGVSPATVSRVLNGRCGGKTNTHRRVREILRSKGYTRKKRVPPKATILCVNEYSDATATSHSLKILSDLDEIASLRQCELITIHTSDPKRIGEKISDPEISGVVYLGDVLPNNVKKPSVVINKCAVHETCSSVDCDDILGLEMLLRELKKLGHEQIAYFSDVSFDRHATFPRKSFEVLKAFSQVGVDNPLIWDFNLVAGGEQGVFAEIAEEFLALPPEKRPTTLVLCGDTYASFAYKAFAERGIRIPEDLSVAGFDDEPFSTHLSPPLASVRKPLEQMAETAVDLILEFLESADAPTKRILIKPEVVLRESVGEMGGEQ
jgi:DNA-binding LacI/PurR family transcriptional regulator